MNLRAHQHRQQKIIMYAATILFLVTSSIIFYAVKDGVDTQSLKYSCPKRSTLVRALFNTSRLKYKTSSLHKASSPKPNPPPQSA